MITQLEILTKNLMGAPANTVNSMELKAYEYDEEVKKLDEEMLYFSNYSEGSCPTYPSQGWN